MKIKVKMKMNNSVPQPTTVHAWEFGYIVGFVSASEFGQPCAIVQTQRGEFELVPPHALVSIP
ncbi:hypothetical protein LCGC14_0351750 [marine sediment metagenome]|uniref:Uncharacterized protein n=1 Tax=marine sediment metagenome TaxID=412755 RepID=A0A0F9VY20_9ZZZZ